MKIRMHSRKVRSNGHASNLNYGSLEGRRLLAAVSIPQVCQLSDDITLVSSENVPEQKAPIHRIDKLVHNVQNRLEVTEISVGDGTVSRSIVDQLTLSFNGIVDLEQGALEITHRESGESVDLVWTTDNSSGQSVITVTFSGTLTESGGSLEDGNYQLNVNGSLLGGDLPGTDFVFGDQEADGFYRYFADSDGNRVVNVIDLLGFRKTYGSTMDDVEFDKRFDHNGDGGVNVIGLLKLRQNYGSSLPWT